MMLGGESVLKNPIGIHVVVFSESFLMLYKVNIWLISVIIGSGVTLH